MEEKNKKIENRQQRSLNSECQEGNPPGTNYLGEVHVTRNGDNCAVWNTSESLKHNFLAVGEHNHCRNPNGKPGGVWCFTTIDDRRDDDDYDSRWDKDNEYHSWLFTDNDNSVEWRWEYCNIPMCATKVLDFSADNDNEPDNNDEYSSASLLDAGVLPESFTICSAYMVETWTTEPATASMFTLLGRELDVWGYDSTYFFIEYSSNFSPIFHRFLHGYFHRFYHQFLDVLVESE